MNDRVLNLDELFGNSRPVVIVWKEKRFDFTLPEGMSPAQNNNWMKLQMRITNIQNKVSDITEGDAEELEDLVGKILESCLRHISLKIHLSLTGSARLSFMRRKYFRTWTKRSVINPVREKTRLGHDVCQAERGLWPVLLRNQRRYAPGRDQCLYKRNSCCTGRKAFDRRRWSVHPAHEKSALNFENMGTTGLWRSERSKTSQPRNAEISRNRSKACQKRRASVRQYLSSPVMTAN